MSHHILIDIGQNDKKIKYYHILNLETNTRKYVPEAELNNYFENNKSLKSLKSLHQKEDEWNNFINPHITPPNKSKNIEDTYIINNANLCHWIELENKVVFDSNNSTFTLECLLEGDLVLETKLDIEFNSHEEKDLSWLNYSEKSLNISLPPKAIALRMVYCEMKRILGHLQFISLFSRALKIDATYDFSHEQMLTGQSLFPHRPTLGGMKDNFEAAELTKLLHWVQLIQRKLIIFHRLLTHSKIFKKRTQIGKITGETALNWGWTGPCLRATGINWDLRKTDPYYFYHEMEFEIPLGINGTCFDRYLVRIEEINQSCQIIEQILHYLPSGSWVNNEINNENISITNINSNSNSNSNYTFLEDVNGELGISLQNGKAKKRHPNLNLLAAIPEMIFKYSLSEANIIFTSLHCTPASIN